MLINCKAIFEHFYKTLYFRFIFIDYLKLINAIINVIFENKQIYIKR